MLSGETAIGQYPRQAVRIMRKVMAETEPFRQHRRSLEPREIADDGHGIASAVIFGAAQIARRLDARMVVIATSDGEAALVKSRQRDFVPTVAVTDRTDVLGKMCLYWGIVPMLAHDIQRQDSLRSLIQQWALDDPGLVSGDRVVLVVDTEVLAGIHDLVVVIEIDRS
jgi:pyruvate kinase